MTEESNVKSFKLNVLLTLKAGIFIGDSLDAESNEDSLDSLVCHISGEGNPERLCMEDYENAALLVSELFPELDKMNQISEKYGLIKEDEVSVEQLAEVHKEFLHDCMESGDMQEYYDIPEPTKQINAPTNLPSPK